MAQTIKLKRSATSGAVPTTSALDLGEMAINTHDGKVYIKKDDGAESVIEVGADQTPEEILTAIKTVDGSGSGLDADLLDGQQGSYYQNASNINAGTLNNARLTDIFKSGAEIPGSQDLNNYRVTGYYSQDSNADATSGSNYPIAAAGILEVITGDQGNGFQTEQRYSQYNNNDKYVRHYYNGNWTAWAQQWNSSSDGSGSGLDADTVDGLQGSDIVETSDAISSNLNTEYDAQMFSWNTGTTGKPASSYGQGISIVSLDKTHNNSSNWITQLGFGTDTTTSYFRTKVNSGAWSDWHTIWNSANDGSGSGLDADLLDGVQGSSFLRSDQDDTMTGDLLMDSANAEINMKAGAAGTSGAVNWTFNTTGTNYASIKLPYDTRNSTGFHIDSAYPITLDATSTMRFDISGSEKMRLFANGNFSIGTTSSLGKLTVSNNGAEGIEFFPANFTGGNTTQHYNRNGSAYLINKVIASEHRFDNSGAEKMRLNSAGHLLHSTTSTTPTTGGTSILGGNASLLTQSHAAGTSPYGSFQQYKYNSSVIGSVARNGNTGVFFVTSSDGRLKENIKDSDDAGSKIDAIQVRQYDWKVDGSHQDYGMIAQELIEVAPEAVSTPEDSEEMMGIDYSKLVPMLIKEIQSLRNRVAQLEE